MPNVYLYSVLRANPADVVLSDPTVLASNISIGVAVSGNRATGRVNLVSAVPSQNVLLYQTEAIATNVKLRYIGETTGSATNVDVNVSRNFATGLVGSVGVTGDANVTLTGLIATGLVGTSSVTGDANVSVSGNLATGLVGTVTVTTTGATDVSVSVTGNIATGLVGNASIQTVDLTDAGGGRYKHPYWRPYQIDKQEWKKKVPPKAAQAIERVARSSKRLEAAEAELKIEIAEWDARYAKMLAAMQAMQLNSLKVLKQIQLDEIAKFEAHQAVMERLKYQEQLNASNQNAIAILMMLM